MGTIVLVEDNQDDEALTRRALIKNNCPHKLIVLSDGPQALEYLLGARLDEGGEPPQLILLDLKLPKVDGLELLRQLRACEHTKLLPVVVLTSSNEDQDRFHAYTFGANSYVCKPVDFTEFTEAVRQIGLYWLVLNQPPLVRGRRSL